MELEPVDTDLTAPDAAPDASAPAPTPDAEPKPKPEVEDKDKARENYKLRQMEKRLQEIERENTIYKQREDEARKSKLSETERMKEELEQLKAERETFRLESLRRKVANEYDLPDTWQHRLVGSDEDSLRADAETLAKTMPPKRVGASSNPVSPRTESRIYTREELRDNPTLAMSPEVIKAAREGRVR